MKKKSPKKNEVTKFGSFAKIEAGHFDLTREISVMCLNRYISRIKAQVKHLEKSSINNLWQIKGCKKDFSVLKKALKIIESYTG